MLLPIKSCQIIKLNNIKGENFVAYHISLIF